MPPPRDVPTDDFWRLAASLTHRRNRLTIVSPNATDLLTISDYWEEVSKGTWWLQGDHPGYLPPVGKGGKPVPHWRAPVILSPSLTITGGRCARGRMLAYSLRQYADVTAAELVRCHGDPADVGGDGGPHPRAVCAAAGAFFRAAVVDWLARGWGNWQSTAGRLAMAAWRAAGRPKNVTGHRCPEAAEIEAYACHGGRASVWFTGAVGRPESVPAGVVAPPADGPHRLWATDVHHVDMSSLYPWLLGEHVYPDRLRGVRVDMPPKQLPHFLQHNEAIARVVLSDARGEYPVRGEAGTLWPRGEVETVLAGPELAAACADGIVQSVPLLLRYGHCRPFVAWRSMMMSWREDARRAGNRAAEILAKTAANSFGGKFTQRRYSWPDRPTIAAEREWGEWHRPVTCEQCRRLLGEGVSFRDARARTGCACVTRVFRGFAGRTQERVPGKPSHRLPAAVYAYLTAYGRLTMRRLREQLPPRTVLAQDVDGLWVTDEGLEALSVLFTLSDRTPGKPRLTRSVGYARFYDPRCYFAGDRWTISGIATGYTVHADMTATGSYHANPVNGRPRIVPRGLTEAIQRKAADKVDPDHRPGPDGWHVAADAGDLRGVEPPPRPAGSPFQWLRNAPKNSDPR